MSDEPAVRVTLSEIWREQQEQKATVNSINNKLDKFISVNERLDSHKADIAKHDDRLDKLEGERIPKIEAQMSAIWVIHGLLVTGIGALVVKTFIG